MKCKITISIYCYTPPPPWTFYAGLHDVMHADEILKLFNKMLYIYIHFFFFFFLHFQSFVDKLIYIMLYFILKLCNANMNKLKSNHYQAACNENPLECNLLGLLYISDIYLFLFILFIG